MAAPARVVEKFFECSLLGMVASGFFALLESGRVDWPIAIVAFAAMCFRAAMAWGRGMPAIPKGAVNAIALVCLALFPVDYLYGSQSLERALLHLIVLLGAVKLVTAKTPRDFTIVKSIAVIEIVVAAAVSVNLGFLPLLAAFLLFAIGTFASGEVLRSTRAFLSGGPSKKSVVKGGLRAFPRRLGFLSGGLFAGVLVLT